MDDVFGLKYHQGAKARGMGIEKELSPTLTSDFHNPAIVYRDDGEIKKYTGCNATLCFDTTQVTSPENGCNPQWNDPCHPVCAKGHAPAVIYTVDGDIARGARYKKNGKGWQDSGASPTLSTMDMPAVVYCRAGLQANSEMYENLAPCMSHRQYKDPPVLIARVDSDG